MDITVVNTNRYRLAWIDTITEQPGHGTFLFNEPVEARDTIVAMKQAFPTYQVWLEERDGNRVEIPPR